MAAHSPKSMFVRPKNMRITHILQTLSIARQVAQTAKGSLMYAKFAREADQMRLLNFGLMTFDSKGAADEQMRAYGNGTQYVPLNSRAATHYDSLHDIGLPEVAKVAGIELNSSALLTGERIVDDPLLDPYREDGNTERLVLAEPDVGIKENVFHAYLKIAESQTGEGKNVGMRRKTSAWVADVSDKEVEDALQEFGGFSRRTVDAMKSTSAQTSQPNAIP